ncbi:hypothetical protein IWQ61_004974 [Dispira simplex]|nr:hypothetical protein IWQ61_004974 [Dispira simplex]
MTIVQNETPANARAESTDNPVLTSARHIAQYSVDVHAPPEGVHKAARSIYDRMRCRHYSHATWKSHELNPKDWPDDCTVDWIFLVDTLNFSFWSDEPLTQNQYTVRYRGQNYRGYWALCAAVNRALESGYPCTSASFMQGASMTTWKHIFRSETIESIPLFETRVKIIRDTGRVLQQKYQGSFIHCINESRQDALALVQRVTTDFDSYRDVGQFLGRPVCFYKRAQILVADLWACFEGRGPGSFRNIDKLTMFADYRVPQALVYVGALTYSTALTEHLRDPQFRLANGSRQEMEIRGNSIWAVELLCHEIRRLMAASKLDHPDPSNNPNPNSFLINSVLIDFYLWDMAKEQADELAHIPIHRTRCHFY